MGNWDINGGSSSQQRSPKMPLYCILKVIGELVSAFTKEWVRSSKMAPQMSLKKKKNTI